MCYARPCVHEALFQITGVADGRLPALIPKFGSQPGLGITPFQIIWTFHQNLILFAKHHYLQNNE